MSTYIIRSIGVLGRGAREEIEHAGIRVGSAPSADAEARRVQLGPVRLVEPEELHALRVALAAGLPGHQVHPAELVGEALEGELVRQPAEHLAGDQIAEDRGHLRDSASSQRSAE